MNELKVIENELVPVYETSTGEKVVYGSELHEVLGVKSRYREWIDRRLLDIDAVENEDFQAAEISAPSGQTKKEYIIKLDTAKEMAMLERNEKGKQVRRYFIQVEKKYKNAQSALEGLSVELQAVIVVDKRVTRVENRIKKLENNMTITHEQIQTIRNRINHVIVELLGGKESNAYKDKRVRSKAYSKINSDYCDFFRINARANTLASRYEEALRYIDMWQPDTNLRIQIQDCNAQISMEVA